ncbi:MAG: hypothetical protein JWN76_2975 [Chitinophagaceae bacterium]|nr:hypothetical protein [Chitinophagaceae bacterium]
MSQNLFIKYALVLSCFACSHCFAQDNQIAEKKENTAVCVKQFDPAFNGGWNGSIVKDGVTKKVYLYTWIDGYTTKAYLDFPEEKLYKVPLNVTFSENNITINVIDPKERKVIADFIGRLKEGAFSGIYCPRYKNLMQVTDKGLFKFQKEEK